MNRNCRPPLANLLTMLLACMLAGCGTGDYNALVSRKMHNLPKAPKAMKADPGAVNPPGQVPPAGQAPPAVPAPPA